MAALPTLSWHGLLTYCVYYMENSQAGPSWGPLPQGREGLGAGSILPQTLLTEKKQCDAPHCVSRETEVQVSSRGERRMCLPLSILFFLHEGSSPFITQGGSQCPLSKLRQDTRMPWPGSESPDLLPLLAVIVAVMGLLSPLPLPSSVPRVPWHPNFIWCINSKHSVLGPWLS